jgi:nucleoside-diphosphate-sugar epimerase
VEGRPYAIPFTGRAGFVHVDDVVDAIVAASDAAFEGAHVFNLVGEVRDVDDVIAEIARQCPGARLRAEGEPLALSPDVPPSDLDPILQGLKVTSLRDGIARTLAFHRWTTTTT